jgi:glycosyltransferase involved in cell wall biosynthesis
MYNLMRRTAADYDQILVAFTERAASPSPELMELFVEIVLVHRPGTHDLPATSRPETVEEFDSLPFRAALRETVRKWRPAIAQLEFTQMAQYAADCAPARTVLVEHDITFDLAQQMASLDDNPDLRRDLDLWRSFETAAWRTVDRVVVMSSKDREMVQGASAAVVPNGVDCERFRPAQNPPEPRRILFIGSFAHKPNRMAVEFFVNQVFPLLRGVTFHIIAGMHPQRFPVAADLTQPGIELEAFVADVRAAYERAAVVVAPLTASAGTNIKVLEAMAMGRAVVSTPAGVNGLDLGAGEDFLLVEGAEQMAKAIEALLGDSVMRTRIERNARIRVEREYDWDAIARTQAALYCELLASG